MSWVPPNHSPSEQTHIKKYMICKIGTTSIGYMHLMENGTLQKGDGHVITLSEPDTTAGMAPCIAVARATRSSGYGLLTLPIRARVYRNFVDCFTDLFWGFNIESICAQRMTEGFSPNHTAYDLRQLFRQNICTHCVLCESELLVSFVLFCCSVLLLIPLWVKQCCN